MDTPTDPSGTGSGVTHTQPAGPPTADHTPLPPAATLPAVPAAPLAFGKYEVVGELGEGGMGRVYKAVDRELGRVVAVKVLRTADPFEAGRFRGEAELTARFDHPNIIHIFEIESAADGRPYLVLEFADGGSLDKELKGQPQEPRRAAEMIETLARAVQYAHEQGVIHRDLKPANVLRAKDGTLKLTDFGLAKQFEVSSGMTPSGAVMGTPSYMAPEQAEGKVKELGPPTDVYGLGAILYELLTGRPPFRGVNMVDTLEQVKWSDPAPPSRLVPRLPRDLGTICLKCLAKAPGRRYATAGQLADDLRRWLNGETILARPAPAWERLWRAVRRRPWQAATATVTVLAGLALAAGVLVLMRQEEVRAFEHKQHEVERLVAESKEKAQRQLGDERRRNEEKLRRRGEQSLKALNGIRGLVLDGELSRTPGLDPLHRALFAYYKELIDGQREEGGYDPADLADACVKIGELVRRTGDKDQARQAYATAEELYRKLAVTDPAYRARLADARLKGGRVAYELGDEAAAAAACDEARRLWDAVRREADTPEAKSGAAEVRHLQGELLGDQRKFADAARAFNESIALRVELAAADRSRTAEELARLPADARRLAIQHLRDLARGYGYLGDVLLDDRKVHDADRAYWGSHHIREKLEAALTLVHKGDRAGADLLDARMQLARSWSNFATSQTRHGALGTARHFAEKALDLQRKLVEASPNNVEYRLDLCNTLNRIAGLNLLLDERDGTDALLAQARDVPRDDLSAKDGHSVGARGTLAEARVLRAQLLADSDREAARRELDRAADLLDGLCRDKSASPSNLFNRSAALALQSEFGGSSDPRRDEALKVLEGAVKDKQYRERHPDDVRRMRAFRSLAGDPRFEAVVKQISPE
jgi:hypothetical protein